MRSCFVDASALAKGYAPEVGTLLVDHLFANAPLDRLCVLNIGIAEVASVLVGKKNAGRLAPASYLQAMVNVGRELVASTSLNRVETDSALVVAAISLLEKHSLNATDAILLRSALDVANSLRTTGDDLVLVASDQRLLRAAQAEGLVAFNPETQTQQELDALLAP